MTQQLAITQVSSVSLCSEMCDAPRLDKNGEEEEPGYEVHHHHLGQLLVWSSAGWRDCNR